MLTGVCTLTSLQRRLFLATDKSETPASALETPPAPQQLPTLNNNLPEACPGEEQRSKS